MLSPLRYPGGKAKLFPFFVELIGQNNLFGCTYVEPYAGGAGLALKLLSHGFVPRIEINDIDPAIFAFWRQILNFPDQFCARVYDAKLSVDEWNRQKAVYDMGMRVDEEDLAFALYFLNRTSRSGIVEGAGPIGGYAQNSPWKIDARFNKKAQASQILEIARFANSIEVFNEDALKFVDQKLSSKNSFIYLDPPYYIKGSKLYKNFYKHQDHLDISILLKNNSDKNWIVSYDFTPKIVELYNFREAYIYNLQYSAGAVGQGTEVIFHGDPIMLPKFPGFRMAA